MKDTTSKLVGLITEYLTVGGLFNPEAMNHDAVRDILMDCRTEVESLSAQVAGLTDQLAIEKRAVERWTNNAAGYAQKLDAAEAQVAELKKALVHLEQAYRNKHSPQHRSAALDEASGLIANFAVKESEVE